MKEYGLMKETESKTESYLLIDIFKKSKVVVKN